LEANTAPWTKTGWDSASDASATGQLVCFTLEQDAEMPANGLQQAVPR
jgi:hypothetical protein